MRLPETLRRFGESLSDHPWTIAVGGACISAIILGVLFTVLYFAHEEREHRQVWIETRLETLLDRYYTQSAIVAEKMDELDGNEEQTQALLRETRDALASNREEMRQLRIAILEELKQP
jgi:hypothetical protein